MKLRIWPKDATTGEKIMHVFVILLVASLYMTLQLSAWQVLKNDYSRAVAAAPAFWHAIGGFLTLFSAASVYLFSQDMILKRADRTVGGIAAVILCALTFLAYAGFGAYSY